MGQRRRGDAHVKAMDRMPPPAPARAWATLSFWGMTGLDCDMLNLVMLFVVVAMCKRAGLSRKQRTGMGSCQVKRKGKKAIAVIFKLFYRERGKKIREAKKRNNIFLLLVVVRLSHCRLCSVQVIHYNSLSLFEWGLRPKKWESSRGPIAVGVDAGAVPVCTNSDLDVTTGLSTVWLEFPWVSMG